MFYGVLLYSFKIFYFIILHNTETQKVGAKKSISNFFPHYSVT